MTLLDFINQSPSPYHVIESCTALLEAADFQFVPERERWQLEPGGRYYTTRGGKTLIAWREGLKVPAETGIRVIGAHSDSPTLKVKSSIGRTELNGELLSFDIYGSPLLHTWLDRDLELAGALYVRDGDAVESKLLRLSNLPVRLVSIAPHLKREKKIEGVTIDRQEDLLAFLSQTGKSCRESFLAVLEQHGNIDADKLLSFDLCVADLQPAAHAGMNEEFLSAPRLDNLFCAFAALKAILATPETEHGCMIAIFDSEEIGSNTWTGARSNFADAVLERSNYVRGGTAEDLLRAKARSVLISADMAHAEHPSEALKDSTDPENVPILNEGLAVKSSARGNYATGYPAESWFKRVCQDAGLNLQRFMYRCDHGGGSSIGPITTTALGICGIDVGAPMIAMHSAREFGGAQDFDQTCKAFEAVFVAPEGLNT